MKLKSPPVNLPLTQSRCVLVLCAWVGATAQAGEFDCVIEPRQVIELRSPIEGLIERINVDRGSLVKKGQELVVLDSAVDRAQAAISRQRAQMEGAVRSSESRVEFTTAKAARLHELHGQNFISAQGRDEAATEKRLADAELRDAQDNRKLAELDLARQLEIIRLKTIHSPIDGVVVERMLHPGELAESGVGRKPLLKIAQIDVLHVEVLLRADAWGKVALGTLIEVSPDLPAKPRYRATVKVIDRVLDAASGTFGVRLELPNPQRQIPAGIRCRASFPGIERTK